MDFIKNNSNKIVDIILITFIIIIIYLISGNILNVITPFIYALILAYILNPFVNIFENKGIKRVYAIILIFLCILVIIALVSMAFLPRLVNDISVFISEIPNIANFIKNLIIDFREGNLGIIPEFMHEFFELDKELDRISDAIRNFFKQLSEVLLASTSTFLDIIITPIITFYYLKDKKRIAELIFKPINPERKSKMVEILRDMDRVLGGFIKGQLIVAAFVGILTGVGCRVIGIPYSITVGLVAGMTNIIPYFGPWLGGIVPVILGLMNNPISAVWVIIWIIIVQQVESSLISPQIMSNSVGLHPLMVIFSVLLFGNLFGIPGMIIGVPLTGIIKVLSKYILLYREIYKSKLNQDKS